MPSQCSKFDFSHFSASDNMVYIFVDTHTIRQDMINESVLQQEEEEEEGGQDGRELPFQDNPRTPDTSPRADLPSWTTISSALIESSSLQDELGEFISPPPKKRVQR